MGLEPDRSDPRMRLKQNWSFQAGERVCLSIADRWVIEDARLGDESNQVPEGYLVDALALRGDEGRGTLR